MAFPFVGEIRLVAFDLAPSLWAFCDGSLVSATQNSSLLNVIGNTYGGDGTNTIGLPDLRGRVPIGAGAGTGLTARTLAQTGGQETVALTRNQIPKHGHPFVASSANANASSPVDALLATTTPTNLGTGDGSAIPMPSIGADNATAHENHMPSLGLRFIIALDGILP